MITVRTFPAGTVILKENEDGETAYIILKGSVEVTKSLSGKPIHLATLGAGEIFGEMSMIDEKPRSATVTAAEDTEVHEIHRDDFFQVFQTNPDAAGKLLSGLFERLRESDRMIVELQDNSAQAPFAAPLPVRKQKGPSGIVVWLTGENPKAAAALGGESLGIDHFPFRVGRATSDPLVHNDWMIPDESPWQVSRHHLAIICRDGNVGIADRGSRLGSEVDGKRLGGRDGVTGPVFFAGKQGTLVIGTSSSPFRYQVSIEQG
ncbi:MAG: cyclic nucleotide-binding domain-containing protein [Planctomycetota bacterium]